MTTFISYLLKTKGEERNDSGKEGTEKASHDQHLYITGHYRCSSGPQGETRDVDEYNRRYDARENEFVMENDTLYIKKRKLSQTWKENG